VLAGAAAGFEIVLIGVAGVEAAGAVSGDDTSGDAVAEAAWTISGVIMAASAKLAASAKTRAASRK
jgi:hypothetical protein